MPSNQTCRLTKVDTTLYIEKMEGEAPKTLKLNVSEANERLLRLGMSQADIADKLDVSREAVSQWFKNQKFPRPGKLLELARLLGLSFEKLVIKGHSEFEPIVAFRKKANRKIPSNYIDNAKDIGLLLENLAPYLPYENYSQIPTLVDPKVDYEYIHSITKPIRDEMKVRSGEKITFGNLIGFFKSLRATIIPVFLGNKDSHENALHIFLPKSRTTWIYLNLDSHICDFKFWMAHELGHAKAPSLLGDIGEDFADNFAGAILIDREKAEAEYQALRRLSFNPGAQINHLKEVAAELVVSPFTVYKEINKFAQVSGFPEILLQTIHQATTVFKRDYPKTVTNLLFDSTPPNPKEYIEKTNKVFQTPFYSSLKSYLLASKKGVSFIHRTIYLPLVDAQHFYEELCQWDPTESS